MLVDSHCHLHNAEYFPGKVEDFLRRAAEVDVQKITVIGTSYDDSVTAAKFAARHNTPEQRIYWTFGVHPSELEKPYRRPDFSAAEWQGKPLAIGEVGLDYHYGPEDYDGINMSFNEMRAGQFRLLEEMLDLGLKNNLPFSFHVREAFDDFFGIVDNFQGVRGVIHSFTDNKKNLARCLERGFYIGVNGMATYSTLPKPPLERILLETDAPFLAPVPHRRQPNEPAYIPDIAKWLAETYQVPLESVVKITTDNFDQIFATDRL